VVELRLIVGLGNPGKKYEYTRHNLGFLVVQRLAQKIHFKFVSGSFINGFVAEGKFQDSNIKLLLPLTYMNNSGVAVKQMAARANIAPGEILVVCDDFNLDF